MSKRVLIPAPAILAGLIAANGALPAAAATATDNIGVSITIAAECLITSVGDIDFGSHGVLSSAVPASTTLVVRCTDTTAYDIGLNAGGGTGATVGAPLLSNTIQYSLYTDAGHTTVWGNTIDIDAVAGTGNGANQTYTVYGLVPAQATPAPNTYTDSVLVTVTY